MKAMDLRHGVDSDKRVSGYKMSAVVRAAQKKFDTQSKGQGKMRPQAGTLAAKKMSEDVELQYIEEKLTASDPASKWISDFVASDNPKFAGKSKKERIQQALGAYYAAKREKNEEVDQVTKEGLDPVGREDKDIDNDGDSDKTDFYLHNKRKAIRNSIRKKIQAK
jgi:hypothetical protein